MANTENINATIAAIRAGEVKGRPHAFEMGYWGAIVTPEYDGGASLHVPEGFCGTVGCIAGTAAILAKPEEIDSILKGGSAYELVPEIAKGYLGLTDMEVGELFIPEEDFLDVIKAPQAIRALEILRDEGVVDWPRAVHEVPL